ncbi:mycofactocin-coupled SDR family oxidoreductase [Nocardioides sp. BP30]|uniref:mycofactocin-coupled SDR family oxidoreductase n=1 Tax=Nocardioides sp. BP30 TaxID=3036374 RepID=UPI0024693005|nr:mycofactocin-coupled SDR family oxidoreductase [Nocardioides sp. BP30]WGL54124.1 mycofactocin-coupled SDR family oxidoreductase [Nocardioides sp. BP30]
MDGEPRDPAPTGADRSPAGVALVTGAARGIGATTVRRLAADGWAVVAVDACAGSDTGPGTAPYPMPTTADLAAVCDGLPDVVPVVADVRDRPALAGAVDVAIARWGRLDAAVAAAGIIAGGQALWETPDEQLQLLWDVDARGVWNLAAVSVPRMLAGPDPSRCRFVAVASAAGSRGLYHLAAYNAAKHAVVGLVKGLAADLVGTGVTACSVSPGSTDTAMLAATADLYGVTTGELARHQLVRRPLAPEELAATIAFACSREGAVLNGSVVAADGGFGG